MFIRMFRDVCIYIVGDLRLNYLRRQYTVSATTHQMAMLLAFNTAEHHTFRSHTLSEIETEYCTHVRMMLGNHMYTLSTTILSDIYS